MTQNKIIRSSQMQTFRIGNEILERVRSFKYLEIHVGSNNDDWISILNNIKKERKSWMRVKTIILCGRFSGKVVSNFYKVIVMSLLLHG